MTFVEKYNARAAAANSLLCVGLDSNVERLPEQFRGAGEPQFEFNKAVIEATHPFAAAYKLNIAFYESRGEAGFRELKRTVDHLKAAHPGIPVLCDAKRGDTVETNIQYAKTLFDWFGFDAATVSPYLGREPLEPFLSREEKGIIVLCRTSNPGAKDLQDLLVNGKPLWQVVAEKVRDEWNARGNCLLVVGATYPGEMKMLREMMGEMTFLVPGVGAQGGEVEQAVRAGLNAGKKGMIINSSRGIIFSDDPGSAAREAHDAINRFR